MSVAKVYAKTLYEVAQEQKSSPQDMDQLLLDMTSFQDLLRSSKEVRMGLISPIMPSKEKVNLVKEFGKRLSISEPAIRFLMLLARKERLGLLTEIKTAFETVRIEAEGGMVGSLVSAEPLVQNDVEDLATAFGKKFGKRIVFQVSTDPSLLAGMKVTVNGVTYDGTLRSQLVQLRDRFVYGTTTVH